MQNQSTSGLLELYGDKPGFFLIKQLIKIAKYRIKLLKKKIDLMNFKLPFKLFKLHSKINKYQIELKIMLNFLLNSYKLMNFKETRFSNTKFNNFLYTRSKHSKNFIVKLKKVLSFRSHYLNNNNN
mmetsp:Transcript_27393/g.38092  ORF Transcript_27393/g.38092 Transcript_27393/m.38092 type:complete len:126 (-) Transcript_27393:724-1101(-)